MNEKMTLAERVMLAFSVLLSEDPKYFHQLFEQRNPGPKSQGSVFNEPQTAWSVVRAVAESGVVIPHADLGAAAFAPCTYINVAIPGHVGVVDLMDLRETITPHKIHLLDPKQTVGTDGGGVEPTVYDLGLEKLISTPYTTIVIGPSDSSMRDCIWTLHPGRPLPRNPAANDPALVGKVVTVEEALTLGFYTAKLATKEA